MNICNAAGCYALIPRDEKYCEKHHKERVHEVIQNKKGTRINWQFYATRKWHELSKSFRVEHPLCAECLRQNAIDGNFPVALGVTVDHIVPLYKVINAGGTGFERDNLQSLCRTHHADKTRSEMAER